MMVASDNGHQSVVQLLFKSRSRINETNEVSEKTSISTGKAEISINTKRVSNAAHHTPHQTVSWHLHLH